MDDRNIDNAFDDNLSNAELINNDSFLKLKAKNKHKELRRRIFYLLIGIALTVFVAVICIVVFFGLKNVEIRGNSKYSEEQILKACGFSKADNLLALDFDKAEEKIKTKCPYISDVSFKVVLPSTVIITVVEDAPSYFAEIYGDYFLMSEDLRIISKHDMYEEIEILSLPIIYLKLPQVSRAVAGEVIKFDKSSSYNHIMSFLTELKDQEIHPNVDCVDATDRYHLSIYSFGSRYKIDIGTSDNLDTKLRFVYKVIEEAFNEYSIVSFNVEKVNQIVVLEHEELFDFK